MKKINTYPFFLMVKAIGEIFQKHSSPMAGILFLGNWPEKDAYLWKGQFFKMIFLQIWAQIRIPLEKLSEETAFLFLIFLEEVGQISEKLDFWG